MIIIVKTSYLVMTSWIGTHNFAVNGVSKVLMQSNDEAAGDEEAADGGNVCGGYIQKIKTLQKTCRTIGM